MSVDVDFSGQRILVVEDDYFLATDTARAIAGAGAEVLGPYPTEQAARDEIARRSPTGAVVDINLGCGPSFALARLLLQRRLPFVFVTGYDETVVPAEFLGVPRLQKPVEPRQVVSALAAALGVGTAPL